MKKPSRTEDKYWQGTRNFDHIQFEQDLEEYIDFSELPEEAQEGLKELGEKIGDSEWDDIFENWEDFKRLDLGTHDFGDWLKENFYPPKPKNQ